MGWISWLCPGINLKRWLLLFAVAEISYDRNRKGYYYAEPHFRLIASKMRYLVNTKILQV